MPDWLTTLPDHWTDVGPFGGLLLLGALTVGTRDDKRSPWLLVIAFAIVALSFYGKLVSTRGPSGPGNFDYLDLAALVAAYALALYMALAMVVRRHGAWLTERRGEKWVKEIDYLYTVLGGVGVLAALGRLSDAPGPLGWVDLVAPITLATALVLRLIKTRAEIEGWHKADGIAPPVREP